MLIITVEDRKLIRDALVYLYKSAHTDEQIKTACNGNEVEEKELLAKKKKKLDKIKVLVNKFK